MTRGPTAPVGVTYVNGAYVRSDAPGSGERPVVPYAARSRKVETPGAMRCQNCSWESTYDALTFGRNSDPKAVPNAEFRSTRAPACRNSFCPKESCSCANNPRDLDCA